MPEPCETLSYETKCMDCASDIPVCLMSWCCPCVVFGQNMDSVLGKNCAQEGAKYIAVFIIMWILNLIIGAASNGTVQLPTYLIAALWHGYMGMTARKAFREKWAYSQDQNKDFFLYCCCEPCAIGQDALECKKKMSATAPGAPPPPAPPTNDEVVVPVAEVAIPVAAEADVETGEMKVEQVE